MLLSKTQSLKFLLGNNLKNLQNKLIKLNKFYFTQKDKPNKNLDEDKVNTNDLIEVLDKEINDTETSYESVMPEGEEFLKKNRWVLFEQDKNMMMELKKSTGEFDITVKFSSKPPEISDNTKESSDPERYLDFYVTLVRNNKKSGLFIEAVTVDSSVNVNQIHFSENVNEYATQFLASSVIENYTGPEFGTLDEKLQQEFLDLFVSLGLDDELGSFIEVVSVDKDERLYLNWMKTVKNALI